MKSLRCKGCLFKCWTQSTLADRIYEVPILPLTMTLDYVPKLRGVSLSRLWKRYVSLKTNADNDTKAPLFQGQSLIDARWRTINWPFFHALVRNVGAIVPTIADALHQNALNQQALSLENAGSGADQVDTGDGPTDSRTGENSELNFGQEKPDDTALADGKHALEDDLFSIGDDDDDGDDPAVDEDREHIHTLIQLTGDPNKYFDTERWCRMLLWTIHMYVDGYCSDYTFQYGRPYAPSYDAVVAYIDQHDGDPFVLQAPVSSVEALLPHQTAIALLPKPYLHLLPKPIQQRLENKNVINRVFPTEDEVDISEVIRLTAEISLSEYSNCERKFLVHGKPFLLRHAFKNELGAVNEGFYQSVPKPGPKFRGLRRNPVIIRKTVGRTTEPPCYPWPAGGFENMLMLPYVAVAGNPLRTVDVAKDDAITPGGSETNDNSARTVDKDSSSNSPSMPPSKGSTGQIQSSQNRGPVSKSTRSNEAQGGMSGGTRVGLSTQSRVDRGNRRGSTGRGRVSERGFGGSRRTRGRHTHGRVGSGGREVGASRSRWDSEARLKDIKRVRDTTPGDGGESG